MVEINTNLASKLIETQFPGWKDLHIKPVEMSGHDNRMFRLGDNLVIRMPSSKIYEKNIEKEFFWLPKLKSGLPRQIPEPIALGAASAEYPYKWAIYHWIEGKTLSESEIDMEEFPISLARFLNDLYKISIIDGPAAGEQNFHRGGDLNIYDDQARQSILLLKDKINYSKAMDIWDRAISSKWKENPVWVHGDLSPGNIIIDQKDLKAVIDFGQMGMGDPACDLAIAYNYFDSKMRGIFKSHLNLADDVWNRAKGWALWKAALIISGSANTNKVEESQSKHFFKEMNLYN